MSNLRKFLFPTGKCHPRYLHYIRWSVLSNAIVSVQSVLSIHSMLAAIDLDGSDAVRTANYVGKDIIGQVGSLGYMANMAKKADQDPNKFLLYSNGFQQFSYMATCITPMVDAVYFLPIAGTANVMTNISFTGFGAINAKCIQTLAIDNNVGEIYAKVTVLNTIGSSIGMMSGVWLTALIPDHTLRLGLVPLLGIARVYTYNKAVSGILTTIPPDP